MKFSKKQICGQYFDNYFNIKLETNKTPGKKFLKSKDIFITIVHEYLHFIQNISTSYGIKNVAQTYSSIAHFYNSKNKQLPYNITDCNFLTNKNLLAVTEKQINTSDYKEVFDKNDKTMTLTYRERIVTVDILQDLKLKEYKVDIQRSGKRTQTYYFDVTAIEEGMCRIYEEHLKDENSLQYQIPYSLPEIMTRIIFPELENNKAFIFAICDISLMYTNPPELFITILKDFKTNSYIPATIPELYDYCYNNLKLEGIKLIDFWKNTFKEARENIINSCNFEDIIFASNWIDNTINFYEQYRLKLPYFLSLPLEKSPNDTLYRICLLMTFNISPVFFNLKNEYFVFSNQKIDKNINDALFHFMEVKCMNEFIFETDGSICTFYQFCKEYDSCPYNMCPLSKPLIDKKVCCFQKNAISYGMKNIFPTG